MDGMVPEVDVTGELSGDSNSVCLGIPHCNKKRPPKSRSEADIIGHKQTVCSKLSYLVFISRSISQTRFQAHSLEIRRRQLLK